MERPALGIDFSREDRLAVSPNQKRALCVMKFMCSSCSKLRRLHIFFFFQSADQGCASVKDLQILKKVKLRLNASVVVRRFVKRDGLTGQHQLTKLVVAVVF